LADYRYWRIFCHLNEGASSQTGIGELEFRTSISGSQAASGGTPMCGSFSGGFEVGNAFNGTYSTSTTDGWICLGTYDSNGGYGPFHDWIGYDFGEGNEVEIVEVAIWPIHGSGGSTAPTNIILEYSSDGSTWRPSGSASGISYTDDILEVITIETGGYCKYRFLLDDFGPDYRNYCCFPEIVFHDVIDGSSVITDANTYATASTIYSGTYVLLKALDGDTGTVWHSLAEVDETAHWLMFECFLSAVDVVEYKLTSRTDGFAAADTPIGWRLQKWNYGTETWVTIDTITVEDVWSALETRTFVIPFSGWTGKICGVENPSKICGVAVTDIAKVSGV